LRKANIGPRLVIVKTCSRSTDRAGQHRARAGRSVYGVPALPNKGRT